MKKAFVFLLIFAVCIHLPSCGEKKSSPLEYQTGASKVSCDISFGNTVFEIQIDPDKKAVAIKKPECVEGVSFALCEGEYTLEYDGAQIDLPPQMQLLIKPVTDAFSLPEGGLKSVRDNMIEVVADAGEYAVDLLSSGLPEKITYSGVRDFVIDNIEIEYSGKGENR